MEITAWVYILTNQHHTVLYIGYTNNLPTRLWEHRTRQDPKSFTAMYNVSKLVYYEGYELADDAYKRELFLKKKTRKYKEDLIKIMNPEWNDLTEKVTEELGT